MMLRLILAFVVSLSFAPADVSAESPAKLLQRGNSSYASGDYDKASEFYQAAIKGGIDNGHVYYNLGNAQYRRGLSGRAITNYRRALKRLPRDPDIKANLTLARKKLGETLPSLTSNTYRTLGRLRDRVNDFELRSATLSIYFLTILTYLFYRLAPSLPKSLLVGCLTLCSTVFSIYSFFAVEDLNGQHILSFGAAVEPAVVVLSDTEARSGNGENFQAVFLLHEGAEIGITEERGAWIEVVLPGGRQGWVKRETIEKI